jgi:hypothetical protein
LVGFLGLLRVSVGEVEANEEIDNKREVFDLSWMKFLQLKGPSIFFCVDGPVYIFPVFSKTASCQFGEVNKLLVDLVANHISKVDEEDDEGQLQRGVFRESEFMLLDQLQEVVIYLLPNRVLLDAQAKRDRALGGFTQLIERLRLKLNKLGLDCFEGLLLKLYFGSFSDLARACFQGAFRLPSVVFGLNVGIESRV